MHRQSALTDFLAANNISAQQIRDDYQRRRAQAEAHGDAENGTNGPGENGPAEVEAEVDEEEQAAAEAAVARSRRRRQKVQEDAISKIKNKKGKEKDKKSRKKSKGRKKASKDSDDESELSDSDGNASAEFGGYKKAVKLPGQLENCELCGKRFTVTPYSKSGPDGGLLCTPCGKELGKEAEMAKKEEKKKKADPTGRKRRKLESDKLDGKVALGAKTLQQLCLEKASNYAADIQDLGDMPQRQMERLSQIFTKKRVMKPATLPLFLQPDSEQLVVADCAC